MSAKEKTTGFSEAEKQAMRERAAELKAEKGGKKKAEMEKAALDAIAAMPDEDRLIASSASCSATLHGSASPRAARASASTRCSHARVLAVTADRPRDRAAWASCSPVSGWPP